jgi:hypothetical protein
MVRNVARKPGPKGQARPLRGMTPPDGDTVQMHAGACRAATPRGEMDTHPFGGFYRMSYTGSYQGGDR